MRRLTDALQATFNRITDQTVALKAILIKANDIALDPLGIFNDIG